METEAPSQSDTASCPPRLGLLACSVFEQEIAVHGADAEHLADVRFFEMGLHDRPDHLRQVLQEAIDGYASRDDLDAVVLAYGLCGRGTAGLQARRQPLVLPRAHDCITLFLGSKEAYSQRQRGCATCYHYTPGWNRNRRVPGPERLESLREELAERFEPDDVDYLLEAEHEQWAAYNTATFIDLGTGDAETEADYAKRCADWLGWRYEHLHGNPALLRDLLWGRWDDARFQVVEPGCQVGTTLEDAILCAEPVTKRSGP